MKAFLTKLSEYKYLPRDQARQAVVEIAEGRYSGNEIAAFLMAFIMRQVSQDELSGFRDALLDLCVKTDLGTRDTIDIVGTGGDEKNTFNISTLASFVVAGAGEKVAKHGNYGVSSASGASNVLELLGYRFTNDHEKLRAMLDQAGICFLHAPLFHPAMKNVAPVRRSMKMKTFFNMLGPMVNPSFPNNQMLGVYSMELARMYAYIYQESDTNFAIIHSLDGYDEISLTGPFKLIDKEGEKVVQPGDIGFERVRPEEIHGGKDPDEAAKIFTQILDGKGSRAQNDVVVCNAAHALKLVRGNDSFGQCTEAARESLMGGKAKQALEMMINQA